MMLTDQAWSCIQKQLTGDAGLGSCSLTPVGRHYYLGRLRGLPLGGDVPLLVGEHLLRSPEGDMYQFLRSRVRRQ